MTTPPNGRAEQRKILQTGATGYVSWRLRIHLESRGEVVRCLARRPLHALVFAGMLRGIASRAVHSCDDGSTSG